MGCIVAELFEGRPILQGDDDFDQYLQICKLCGTPSESNWDNFNDLPQSNFAIPKDTLWAFWKSASGSTPGDSPGRIVTLDSFTSAPHTALSSPAVPPVCALCRRACSVLAAVRRHVG